MQQRKKNRIRGLWFLAIIAALVLGGCGPFGGPVTPAPGASATPEASPELPLLIEEGFESGLELSLIHI